jgi:hypothetical protein
VLLAGAHERQADAATTVLPEHNEPVHVPSPSVPCGDQRAHERAAGVGDEQAPGCLGEQPVDILDLVGSSCVRPCHRSRIASASADWAARTVYFCSLKRTL